jgi:hypothetical protein
VGESAQADYEQLRAAVVAGAPLINAAAGRFERAGLAGLIVAPNTTVVFNAVLVGGERPPWTPHADPRHDALAEAYILVLGEAGADDCGLGGRAEGRRPGVLVGIGIVADGAPAGSRDAGDRCMDIRAGLP